MPDPANQCSPANVRGVVLQKKKLGNAAIIAGGTADRPQMPGSARPTRRKYDARGVDLVAVARTSSRKEKKTEKPAPLWQSRRPAHDITTSKHRHRCEFCTRNDARKTAAPPTSDRRSTYQRRAWSRRARYDRQKEPPRPKPLYRRPMITPSTWLLGHEMPQPSGTPGTARRPACLTHSDRR